MNTTNDTTTRPAGWRPASTPAREGSTQRFRVELLKFTGRGHIEAIGRLTFADEAEALAAWAAWGRPARVRARLVCTVTQEWIEPARDDADGVRFAVHRLHTDAHARREIP